MMILEVFFHFFFPHLQSKKGRLGVEVDLAGSGVPVAELLEDHPPDEAPAVRRGLPAAPDLQRSVITKCFSKYIHGYVVMYCV